MIFFFIICFELYLVPHLTDTGCVHYWLSKLLVLICIVVLLTCGVEFNYIIKDPCDDAAVFNLTQQLLKYV
jgi:hypothetical protein